MNDGHPGDGLSALVDGELDGDEESAVRAHVAACSRCADELEGIRRVRRTVRLLPAVEPPAGLLPRPAAGPGGDPPDDRSRGLAPLVPLRRRRVATTVAVAAAVAAVALVGGADLASEPVAASLDGAVQAHSATLQAGVLGTSDPATVDSAVATTAVPMAVDRLPAPYRAPVTLDGGYRLVQAFRHADGLQLLYQQGGYGLSVFELEGRVDVGALPDTGRWVHDDGEAAWQVVDGDGDHLVLLARSGMTVTAVGDEPGDAVLKAVRSLPGPRSLSLPTRLRRACVDALRSLGPLS